MNRGITRKIVSTLIIALFLVEAILPLQAYADISQTNFTTSTGQASSSLNYDNPNSGNNPYKPKVKDFLNPQLLSQVVGCTGIVNKVSDKVLGAVEKVAKKLADKAKKAVADFIKKQLVKKGKDTIITVITGIIQTALGVTTTTVVGTGTQFGTGAGKGIENVANQNLTSKDVNDPDAQKKLDNIQTQNAEQHAEDTRAADVQKYRENCLNGIAIQLAKNQLSAMTKHTMSWINTGFNGDSFYVKNVDKYMKGIEDGILEQETKLFKSPNASTDYPYGRDFATGAISAKQSTENFNNSLKQDLTNYLAPGATPDSFANDFSEGGWDGWLALTQHTQNNPLGFTLLEDENIANKQDTAVQNTKDELTQGGGYLSQKKCVEYAKANPDDDPSFYQNADGSPKCLAYETVTPGSTIKAKVDTYVNTPENQLTLVKTMNDALNVLFTMLMTKFENNGLAGLNPSQNITPLGAGIGANQNITFDEDGYITVEDTPSGEGSVPTTTTTGVTVASGTVANPHTYIQDDGFDITKDLGNTYDEDGVLIKKGVIQNQYDYIDAMGIYKSVIADVLPALGELDYCIPGPNPNWRENSADAITAYLDTLSGIGDAGDLGITQQYMPDGTFEYPKPVPQDPPKKRLSLLKRLAVIVSPTARLNETRKKFKENAERRQNEKDRAVIEADNERIRLKNEQIKSDMLAGRRPLDPIFIANTIGTDRDSILRIISPENTGLDPTKLLVTLDDFESSIDAIYGLSSPMQNYWLGNTKYLQMSQEGLNITKNIPDYIDSVEAAKLDSRDLLAEATPNLDKLKAIQIKVNAIIAAAQQRRNAKVKKEGGPALSQACLLKEKVTYTDFNGKIMSSTSDRPLPVIKTRAEVKSTQ